MIELRISVTENVGDEDVNHDLKAAHAYQQAVIEAGLASMCAYHRDAGFCIDELREPTHWILPPPPEIVP